MANSLEQIAAKMDALGLWQIAAAFNWAVKPKGTAFPYFCTLMKGDMPEIKVRFLMLEGWQTLHDFLHTRHDPNYGFYSSPMELPHFEMIVLHQGAPCFFRHDPGYMPRPLAGSEAALVEKVLWESYGVMMRFETDRDLAMRYASERALFGRLETSPGLWSDSPFPIPEPRPHVERVTFAKADIAKAKDLPFVRDLAVEVDLRIVTKYMTMEPRPRYAYVLMLVDSKTGERLFRLQTSVPREGGLRDLWESVAPRLLSIMIAKGKVPGEVKVVSQRMFRMLRPLCLELPFKLSLHDSLEKIEAAFAQEK